MMNQYEQEEAFSQLCATLKVPRAEFLTWLKAIDVDFERLLVLLVLERSSFQAWRWINVDVIVEKVLQSYVLTKEDLTKALVGKMPAMAWDEVCEARDLISLPVRSMEEPIALQSINSDTASACLQDDIACVRDSNSINAALLPFNENETDLAPFGDYETSKGIWIADRAVLVCTQASISKVLAVKGFKEGFEFVVDRAIHTTLLGFLLYQLLYSDNVFDAVEIYRNADAVTIRNMIHLVTKTKLNKIAWYLIPLPVIWGGLKALYNANLAKESPVPSFRESVREVEEFAVGERCSACLTSAFWNDGVRWLLPLHPLDGHINYLKYCILWDGRLSDQQRLRAFNALMSLLQRTGYTPIAALHLVAKIAHGHAFDQISYLEPTTIETLVKIKLCAFDKVMHDAEHYGGVYGIYARYLRWSLGASPSRSESLMMLVFKLTKLVLKLLLLVEIVKGVKRYLACPDLPGFTYHGFAPWASDYTLSCFNAYVSIFNQIPGQPISSLTSKIHKFHLPRLLSLDLSGKELTGSEVADIIEALQSQDITITYLNISGNNVNWPEDVIRLFPLLQAVESLDWSHNNLESPSKPGWAQAFVGSVGNLSKLTTFRLVGDFQATMKPLDGQPLQEFAMGLSRLTHLTSLTISNLGMGYEGMQGTKTFAECLAPLNKLTYLDLSSNDYGYKGSNDTQVLGATLGNLTRLTSLDLGDNWIGTINSLGLQAFSVGLSALQELELLRISSNSLGQVDANGTVLFGQVLPTLYKLKTLDLSRNIIGSTSSAGLLKIGEAIAALKHIEALDLSYNKMGSVDSIGTTALMRSLANCTKLHALHLDDQWLDKTDDVASKALLASVSSLTQLSFFSLSSNYVSYSTRKAIATVLKSVSKVTEFNFLQLADWASVDDYFNALPLSTTSVFLSHQVQITNLTVFNHLFDRLLDFDNLTYIDLSNNYFFTGPPAWMSLFGNRLYELDQLVHLDLSRNFIGLVSSEATQAIASSIGNLTQLECFSLSSNAIGYADRMGALALGKSIAYLTNLEVLLLADNVIDGYGVEVGLELANSFKNLTQLKVLSLAKNFIGYTGSQSMVAISNSLALLTKLERLSLSYNFIGSTDTAGSVTLGQSLGNLTALERLDLSINRLGKLSVDGVKSIGDSLLAMSKLQQLSLSQNRIGSTGSAGTLAIAAGLDLKTNLTTFSIDKNHLATHSQDGFNALLQRLLLSSSLQTIVLSDNPNVQTSWQALSPLQSRSDNAYLEGACHAGLCYSRSIPVHVPPLLFEISKDMVTNNLSVGTSVDAVEFNTLETPLLDSVALTEGNNKLLGANHQSFSLSSLCGLSCNTSTALAVLIVFIVLYFKETLFSLFSHVDVNVHDEAHVDEHRDSAEMESNLCS